MKWIKVRLYCWFMRKVWDVSYKIYNWAEGKRPAGGFDPKNMVMVSWDPGKCAKEVTDPSNVKAIMPGPHMWGNKGPRKINLFK